MPKPSLLQQRRRPNLGLQEARPCKWQAMVLQVHVSLICLFGAFAKRKPMFAWLLCWHLHSAVHVRHCISAMLRCSAVVCHMTGLPHGVAFFGIGSCFCFLCWHCYPLQT